MDFGQKPSSVASRFVSQTELSEAQKKREDEVRATYARLGQSPPPEALAAARQETQTYDPRSLYERLKAQTDAKQEAFDERMKLSNQFRGIDEGESQFLADVARERREEMRRKEEETKKEIEEFRKAALRRESSPPNPLKQESSLPTSSLATSEGPKRTDGGGKVQGAAVGAPGSKSKGKRKRDNMLGVIKKKATSSSAPESKKQKEDDASLASAKLPADTKKLDDIPEKVKGVNGSGDKT